jgi:exopolysaccharide biosynthesis polyprenyl glycosylphosphotransferase
VGRVYLMGGALTSLVLQSAWDLGIHWLYRRARSLGFNYRNVLIVGNQYTYPAVVDTLATNQTWGLRVCGIVTLSNDDRPDLPEIKFCGSIHDMERILNNEVIDYVIFTVYRQAPALVEQAMLLCYERGIDIWMKPDFIHQRVALSRIDYMDDIPLLVFSQGPKAALALGVKRVLDYLGACALLLVLLMPMLIIGFLIWCEDGGPVLFGQRRVGLKGRLFAIYKFRTMKKGSDGPEALAQLKNEMNGPIFKVTNDPRVTRIGRTLRKYSFDELPQLLNVLLGHMSLVGPRPPTPNEVDLYRGWHRRRLSMRPGMTGLWQVMGRNDVKRFDDRARLDLKYIDTWSLWLDLRILFMTVPEIVRGSGS